MQMTVPAEIISEWGLLRMKEYHETLGKVMFHRQAWTFTATTAMPALNSYTSSSGWGYGYGNATQTPAQWVYSSSTNTFSSAYQLALQQQQEAQQRSLELANQKSQWQTIMKKLTGLP